MIVSVAKQKPCRNVLCTQLPLPYVLISNSWPFVSKFIQVKQAVDIQIAKNKELCVMAADI